MKGLIKYIHDDFRDWLSDPLYHGGLWEDLAIALFCIVTLAGIIVWGLMA